MIEIREDSGMVASCGLYCGACGSFLKGRCQGCAKNEKASWCKVRSCCKETSVGTCADCGTHKDPKDCGKFNNVISKIFGLLFNSDRRACIMQVKAIGLAGHAKKMTELKRQSLRR